MTQRVALLGKPLKRRHSVVMHNAAFAAAGIDAEYVLEELDEADVPGAVAAARGDGWLGLGVTAPYKKLVATLLDEVEPDAGEIGAVNNVVRTSDGRLIGFNTDSPGFRTAVEKAMGRPLEGAHVVVVGAGGVANAVVYACKQARAAVITVFNRTTPRQVGGFAVRGLDSPYFVKALSAAHLAVNATTVGMIDQGMSFSPVLMPPDATVFDCVYVPRETQLIREARAMGLNAANGEEMLIAQAAIAFERWTGVGGMTDVMRDAVAPLFAQAGVTA